MSLLPGLSRADVWLIDAHGAIGPVTADHMGLGLEKAQVAGQDQAVGLRYLQTLVEIAGDENNTIVFPVPIDIFAKLKL